MENNVERWRNDPAHILRLESRRRKMPKEIRRARDYEIARDDARVEVITKRMEGVGWGGIVATHVVDNVSQCVEVAASHIPEERHRVDSIAETVAITMNRLVAELGQ